MNIALIGSGGREHALCQKIYKSKLTRKIFCFPGNGGTAKIAKNVSIDILDFKKLLKFLKIYKIDLVVVGPEEPLVKGLVDYLIKNKINVFGPNKFASQLEGSKAFMKKLCLKHNIPTANFKICKNKNHVKQFLSKSKLPIVVKADGLAAGKGVSICNTKTQVRKFSEEIFKGKFKSSKKIVLEEFLKGEEASYFLIVDKKTFKFFGTAQDHKRVGENDRGANTGGMGAYSPAPIITKKIEERIINRIVKPTLKALKQYKNPYTGFLYVGLMIVNQNPYLIEYNVRMGDPECQVIMPRLKTDFVKILKKAVKNKLNSIKLKWKKEKTMTIVLCSKGYPGKYVKNREIKKISEIKLRKNDFIFHAGTKIQDNKILSNGGRVLNISSSGKNLLNVRSKILQLIKKINWKHGFFRNDIGWRIIKR
tara:strand:+ start:1043 stop:2308 length:1266 start_codon:yes stop_codon:yes gene_type:complete